LDLNYRDPDTARYYLGQVNEEQKNYADALRWYESVTRGEQVFAARIGYAEILAKQGEITKAREALRQTQAKDDRQRVLLIQTEAQLLRDKAMHQEAFNVLGQALKASPNSIELLYDHAMTAEKLNLLDVLETDFRHILEIKPDHAQALNALGYTLADRTDRLQEAVILIEKALKLSPDDAFILDSMGWVQYRLGKEQQALDYLRRAFAIRADPEIAAHLGEVLWSRGKRDEAMMVWRDSLKRNPSNEVLQGVMKKFAP
jgi:tetratricopeptide (TPR) repeat protein